MMKATSILFVIAGLGAIAPTSSPTPSPTPPESASPSLVETVTEASAQRVAAQRSKIYQVGVDYSEWLDQVAKDSGSAFFQRIAFDRVSGCD